MAGPEPSRTGFRGFLLRRRGSSHIVRVLAAPAVGDAAVRHLAELLGDVDDDRGASALAGLAGRGSRSVRPLPWRASSAIVPPPVLGQVFVVADGPVHQL